MMKKKQPEVEDKMVRGPQDSKPTGGFPPHCCFEREPAKQQEEVKPQVETEDDGA